MYEVMFNKYGEITEDEIQRKWGILTPNFMSYLILLARLNFSYN